MSTPHLFRAHLIAALLFTGTWAVSCSCNAQNTVHPANTPPLSIGDTVPGPGNSVFIIFHAANGDYWFGSNGDGVYRYDGKTTIRFSIQDGLCNDQIREIREDALGNIYFSTQAGGVCKFDGQKFATLPVTKSDSPEKDWKLEPGDIWFKGETGKNGPYRYDGKTLHHLEFPKHYMADEYFSRSPNLSWSPYEVYHIYKDKKGNMWFGTGNFGLCRYDGRSLSWMYEDQLQFVPGGGSFGIRSIIEDPEGKFWFCNTRYRYTVFPDDSLASHLDTTHRFIRYKKEQWLDLKAPNGEDVYYMSIIEDNNRELWMATYAQGVWRYDGKNVMHYPLKDGSKVIHVYSVYEDNRGDLWLGTHEYGAYKFNGEGFEKFRP